MPNVKLIVEFDPDQEPDTAAKAARFLASLDQPADLESDRDQILDGAKIDRAAAEMDNPAPAPHQAICHEWNMAGLKRCNVINEPRRKHIRARWRDPYWRENWQAALAKATESKFCNGDNDRGWIADIDWFLRPMTVCSLMEGKYDDGGQASTDSKWAAAFAGGDE